MSNVQKIQAQSFSTLTQLADDPPRYVRVATDREPLKLYIVRVPASQDILLTTFKPRSANVTAEDIKSCLYYLRVETHDEHNDPLPSAPPPHQKDHSRNGSRYNIFASLRPPVSPYSNTNSNSSGASFDSGAISTAPTTLSHQSSSSSHSRSTPVQEVNITFIRRDRNSDTQQTVGQISSCAACHDPPVIPGSQASKMFAKELKENRKLRRERKQLNLEIWNPGYEKFLPPVVKRFEQPIPVGRMDTGTEWRDFAYTSGSGSGSGNEDRRSHGDRTRNEGKSRVEDSNALRQTDMGKMPRESRFGRQDRPLPPPPDEDNDDLAPPPPTHEARSSRFMEIYSPDTPTPSPQPFVDERAPNHPQEDRTFYRTLAIEGEGFFKSTSKRLSTLVNSHRRSKSEVPSYNYHDEETRRALAAMGISSASPTPGEEAHADVCEDELKKKGYVFSAPVSGRCEFETTPTGRKIKLLLRPPGCQTNDALVLSTLSIQPPDTRSSSPFKKPKLGRKDSMSETIEREKDAGMGLRAKMGSLTVESEGLDMLDLVVISSLGVFWKRREEWRVVKGAGWNI